MHVGLTVIVGVGGVDEPLERVRLTPGGEEVVGIGVEEPCAPRIPARGVELGELQAHDSGVELAQVPARSRGHDRELDAVRPLE
jgi:hypothetical protein